MPELASVNLNLIMHLLQEAGIGLHSWISLVLFDKGPIHITAVSSDEI